MTEGERARGIKTKAEGMLNPAVFSLSCQQGFSNLAKRAALLPHICRRWSGKKIRNRQHRTQIIQSHTNTNKYFSTNKSIPLSPKKKEPFVSSFLPVFTIILVDLTH